MNNLLKSIRRILIRPKLNKVEPDSSLVNEFFKHNCDGVSSKTIWIFWDSGLYDAPDVVQLSYSSWLRENPDYDVVFLDSSNIAHYVKPNWDSFFNHCSVKLGAAGKSDLLRLYLLYNYGGVWVDATTFCLKPLSDWLNINDNEFFSFKEKAASDRQLVSWFLVCKKHNEIAGFLLRESLNYLTRNRKYILDVIGLKSTYKLTKLDNLIGRECSGHLLLNHLESRGYAPYFWVFYLFNEVIKNKKIACLWSNEIYPYDYAELDDDINTFMNSVVSKQTYREKYIKKENYKTRKKILIAQADRNH